MKKGKLLIIIGLLLVAAALALFVYNVCESRRAEKSADDVLELLAPQVENAVKTAPTLHPDDPIAVAEATGDNKRLAEYPDYLLNPQMEVPSVEIDGERYIGILAIPSLGKILPVQKTCTEKSLKHAPCVYAGSPYRNDLIIAAHNYTAHFAKLSSLRIGDDVNFTDVDGNVFVYEVVEISNLPSDAVEEMSEGEWDLTLFTCTVSRQERVTVRCRLR